MRLACFLIVLLSLVGCTPALTVQITSPNRDVTTNGLVSFQVFVSGGTPDAVQLLMDGKPFATLSPPYQYTLNTSSLSEDTYEFSARAIVNGRSFEGGLVRVTVDRTSPILVERSPLPDAIGVAADSSIRLTFSERVEAITAPGAAVILQVGGKVVNTTVGLSSDGRTLAITPVNPSDLACTTVSLEVRSGIADQAGNPLVVPAPNPWSWQTLGDACPKP